MNVALILAAGSGLRMNQDLPKQFFHVYDKPVLIYTLESFQNNPNIDAIHVVLLEGWDFVLKAYVKQFGITKFIGISKGGETGQESIFNGLSDLAKIYKPDDIVLIHDGNRPLVSSEIIDNCISVCKEFGNSITAIPTTEAILIKDEMKSNSASNMYDRSMLVRTQTPHAFKLGDILSAHHEAQQKGITNSVASCTLYVELGKKVYLSKGSEKNLKLTTVDDLEIFKALLDSKKLEWLK